MNTKPAYYIMVKTDRLEGKRFKTWCYSQGISMTKAIPLLMREVVDGDFVLKQQIKQNGKNKH